MDSYKECLRGVFVALALFTVGCTVPGRIAYIVFVDYTQSASTFAGENPVKIRRLLQGLTAEMEQEDVFVVYPIHSFTQSASSLARFSGPELQGDLNDEMRKREWRGNIAQPAMKDIWQVQFDSDRTSSTNIYPTVRKIDQMKRAGYKVQAYLVCDMIQDFDGDDFSAVFGSGSNVDPAKLAAEKVAELGFIDMLEGIEVKVLIPGTPHGNQVYDRIRSEVNTFWEEFFSRCGADVSIQDL